MILLEKLRRERGWSKRELWRRSAVDPAYIGAAENKGMDLYPGHARKLAEALEWEGNPEELCKVVDDKGDIK